MRRSGEVLSFFIAAAIITILTVPAQAGLIIVPTFASSITSDPNAVVIEDTINSAIATYESTFMDPITVDITFQEGGGLGGSSFFLYSIPYATYHAALIADATSADDTAALARLSLDGSGINNPVNNSPNVFIKAANARALGITGVGGVNEGGTITLNTNLTNPGSLGSAAQYSLTAVVEHEIDEILGLGSSLPSFATPSPEDLFRFLANGTRTFTTNSTTKAFFSIDGTDDLAQFDNQNDGGDFGDWQSNPLPPGVQPQIQDAFATPFSNPVLGVELRALDVIGYTVVVPEPGTFTLLGAGLLVAGLACRHSRATA